MRFSSEASMKSGRNSTTEKSGIIYAHPAPAPKRFGLYQHPDAPTGAQRDRLGHPADYGGSLGADATDLCPCESVWALPVGYVDAARHRPIARHRPRERYGLQHPRETTTHAHTPEARESAAARFVLAVRSEGRRVGGW